MLAHVWHRSDSGRGRARRWRPYGGLISVLVVVLLTGSAPADAQAPARLKGSGEVVITSGGGTWEAAQKKAFFDPFTRDTGIKVVLVPEEHAKLMVSVKTGVPEADITSISAGQLA